jgi:aspartate/tyrosine/aromatic aminotransferase
VAKPNEEIDVDDVVEVMMNNRDLTANTPQEVTAIREGLTDMVNEVLDACEEV